MDANLNHHPRPCARADTSSADHVIKAQMPDPAATMATLRGTGGEMSDCTVCGRYDRIRYRITVVYFRHRIRIGDVRIVYLVYGRAGRDGRIASGHIMCDVKAPRLNAIGYAEDMPSVGLIS